MKIILIYPRMKYPSGDPPLGVAYIASYIREKVNNVDVKIIDTTFNSSFEFVKRKLKKENPEIVGIYATTNMIKDAYKIAKIAKRYAKLVVLGGPHPSVLPKETFRECKFIDVIVVGEGEYSFLKIIQTFKKTKNLQVLTKIPNTYVYIKKSIKSSKKRYFIKNLDTIPFPAWDLLDMNKYIINWFQMDSVSPKLKGTSILASRSCPFNCYFCQPVLKTMFGNTIRTRSPENIVDELIELRKQYKINSFIFQDDTFLIDKQHVNKFCDLLRENDLSFLWGFNTRVDLFQNQDEKLIKKMYNCGLRLVCIGIESGSQRVLNDIYNKGIKLNQVEKTVTTLKKYGINVRGFFIIGAPTETTKEIIQTIRLATNLKLNEATFSIFSPLPGTYLYNLTKEKGWKTKDDWNEYDYYAHTGLSSGNLNEKRLRFYQRLAFILFYLHPNRCKYLLNSFKTPKRSLLKIKTYFFEDKK